MIAGGKPAKTREEGLDQSVVIVEFENLEKAVAAYDSDVYKAALKVLDKAAAIALWKLSAKLTNLLFPVS